MTADTTLRLKRLKIRSWRRGTREMDMILGPFCDAHAASLDLAALDLFETLLNENDQDLYLWVSGQTPSPPQYTGLIEMIQADTSEH
ncbi:MAG: succinate dehydrogenase assembly factor 2 [Boseongicola sp.]